MKSEYCKHNIELHKSCPWCNREGFKEFAPKRVFQLYQKTFGDFIQENAETLTSGPQNIFIIVEDLNGHVVAHQVGNKNRLDELLYYFVIQREQDKQKCLDQKSRNGLKKLFDLIWKPLKN